MAFRECLGVAAIVKRIGIAAALCAGAGSAHSQAGEALPRQVHVDAIPAVIAAGTEWQLAWQGTDNADGIIGLPDGSVLFAQEQPAQVGRLDIADAYSVYLEGTRGAGSLAMDRDGRLWAVERSCTDPGRRNAAPCTEPTAIARLTPNRLVLADSAAGEPLGRLNDLIVSARGSVYFTVGGAWHAAPDGRVTAFGTDLRTNGIMLNTAETRLYVTNRETIVAFDIAPDGSPAGQRDFAMLEAGGNGDGMAIDAEDRLYVTSAPGVQVFDRDGRFLGLIPTPRPAISVAFGGPDKRTLYVVGSGAALGAGGTEFQTPAGVRNNAKTIYRIDMLARGFTGRAK